MNILFGRSNLMVLIFLACICALLALTVQIIQAQECQFIALKDAIDIALEQNIELQRSAHQVASSAISLGQSKEAFFPDLSASASASQSYSRSHDPMTDVTENRESQSLNLGFSTRLTLFDGFGNIASLQRARIQLANEQLNLEDLRQTVIFEVHQALFDYSTAQKELEAARAQREYSRQALEVTRKRYDVGSAILAELSLVRAQYVAANNGWIQSSYNLLLSRVALDYYSGRLDNCPVIPL